MLRGKAKSGGSTKQGKIKGVALVDSPMHVAPLTSAQDPPPYGARHRQDALWEEAGGNQALPPRWRQFEVWDGITRYQDIHLMMTSSNQPLPGVRLGRSYFVNHNTRKTSWKKPAPNRPLGSLMPECIIEGHSECIWNLACVGTSCNIMSASSDGSIRQWIRDGEPVGEPWGGGRAWVMSLAVSPDQTMVVSGSTDGRLRLWNVKEGGCVGDPWEGHSAPVRCLDWSPNAREIASGSEDGTARQWDPNTGRQIAPPIETGQGRVYAVKYSPRGDKLASGGEDRVIRVCGGEDRVIRVWSKDGNLLLEIKGHDSSSIDGKELVVLRGHGSTVRSICLISDERHLVSASEDCSVRIWDLKTNEQAGDPLLHDDELSALAIPSDGRYIASAGLDKKIYVWGFEAALGHGGDQAHASSSKNIFDTSPLPKRQANNEGLTRYGNEFWSDDTKTTPRRLPPRSGPSPPSQRDFFDFLYFRRPVDASPSIPLTTRRLNFSLFTRRIPAHTVDVAPARDEDLVVLRGHSSTVRSICLIGDERHLVSASEDCSVRIWDLKTNEQVGDPLLHDDELSALAIPSDGRYIASAGLDKKNYVWGFDAALGHGGDQIFDASPLPKRHVNNEGLTRHGNEFWSDDTKSTPRRLPPRRGPSPPSRRNFFDFLYFRRPHIQSMLLLLEMKT
ncbi:WD40 repeat-like protein [Rhizopogon salebrosus TDB-379]|nr:WD40 repeat-like protein [Rhizopogon salebrosus TDB-379]